MKYPIVVSALAVVFTFASPTRGPAQTTSAADSSFSALLRQLVTDSIWEQKPAHTRFFATTASTLALLRVSGIPADSLAAWQAVMCPDVSYEVGVPRGQGWVLSVDLVPLSGGVNKSLLVTVGCLEAAGRGSAVMGHQCGWDLASGESGWRIVRSRRCWRMGG